MFVRRCDGNRCVALWLIARSLGGLGIRLGQMNMQVFWDMTFTVTDVSEVFVTSLFSAYAVQE